MLKESDGGKVSRLTEYQILKKCGKKLGSENISSRVIELCKEVAHEQNYENCIRALGKFKALAMACNFDYYCSEKRDEGYYSELYNIEKLQEQAG